MTQEEKARAYDEAQERAKSFQQKFGGDYAGYIFPELRESEDERMRKMLIARVRSAEELTDELREWILTYLEGHKEIPMPSSTELIEMWDKEKKMLKEKDFRDDAWRIAYNAFMDGFAKGTCVKFEKQKEQNPSEEQLLKEAVEGKISAFGLHNAICIKDPKWTDMLDKYKAGDRVRVIVLPKEDEEE